MRRVRMLGWALLGLAPWAQAGDETEEARTWQLEGYGTLAAHVADDKVVGVRGDGRNRNPSYDGKLRFDGDSLLAVQARVDLSPRVHAVWQLLARDDVRYGQRPRNEWIYLGWDAQPNLNLKLGRTALPVFLHSETRHLGYAQLTARPVNTVYQLNPFTHVDGLALRHGRSMGRGELRTEFSAGRAELALPSGTIDADRMVSLALRYDEGPWSLRLAGSDYRFDMRLANVQRLYSQLVSGATGCTNCATVLAARAPLEGVHAQVQAMALQHESGSWSFTAELARRSSNNSIVADSLAWYTLLAYRVGEWSPYAVLGAIRFREPPLGLQTHPAAPAAARRANALIDLYLQTPNDRRITQLGVRWDLHARAALKLQWERYRATREGRVLGQSHYLEVPAPPPIGPYQGPAWDGRVNQWSLNLDFVF